MLYNFPLLLFCTRFWNLLVLLDALDPNESLHFHLSMLNVFMGPLLHCLKYISGFPLFRVFLYELPKSNLMVACAYLFSSLNYSRRVKEFYQSRNSLKTGTMFLPFFVTPSFWYIDWSTLKNAFWLTLLQSWQIHCVSGSHKW